MFSKSEASLLSHAEFYFCSKKELTSITDLVREKGRLSTAVDDANEVLFNVARDMGIDMTAESTEGEENGNESVNLLLPVTSNIITQKIMSLLNEKEAQSQRLHYG